MRRRHRPMALIGPEVSRLRAELLAPLDGVAAISRMTEIEGVCHLRDIASDKIGIAAVTVAGKDQRLATDALAGAVAAKDFHATNPAARLDQECFCQALGDNGNTAGFGHATQPVDQLRSRARGQAVHAQGGMAGVIEVVDHIERQAVAIGQPFDQSSGTLRDRIYDDHIRIVFRFALDIGGEQLRAVGNALAPLKASTGGWNESGRQRRRPRRKRVTFDYQRLGARFPCRQCRAQTGGARADDQ